MHGPATHDRRGRGHAQADSTDPDLGSRHWRSGSHSRPTPEPPRRDPSLPSIGSTAIPSDGRRRPFSRPHPLAGCNAPAMSGIACDITLYQRRQYASAWTAIRRRIECLPRGNACDGAFPTKSDGPGPLPGPSVLSARNPCSLAGPTAVLRDARDRSRGAGHRREPSAARGAAGDSPRCLPEDCNERSHLMARAWLRRVHALDELLGQARASDEGATPLTVGGATKLTATSCESGPWIRAA
jgi:hypothetical protein